jgi:hypothetical protein
MLTTTTIGMILPSFKEEFGESKSIDLVGTLAHDFIADKIDDLQPSGIYLDKN